MLIGRGAWSVVAGLAPAAVFAAAGPNKLTDRAGTPKAVAEFRGRRSLRRRHVHPVMFTREENTMRRPTLLIGMVTIVVALAAGTVRAAASTEQGRAKCADFAGPAWTFPEFGKKGTAWQVRAVGVTCAYATSWSKKLLRTKYRGEAATKLRGPAGWSCLVSIPHGGGVPGQCSKGAKRFSWGPDAKL